MNRLQPEDLKELDGEKVIEIDELMSMLKVRPCYDTRKGWWTAVDKSKIIELARELYKTQPIERPAWRLKDGKYVLDYGWYEKDWFDCDDYAFAMLGWIRKYLPNAAFFYCEVFIPSQRIYHALNFLYATDSKLYYFEPQNLKFFAYPYSRWELTYLFG